MINDNRLPLKEAFLNYLGEVPVYKWASKAIGKSEDTLLNWRKEDQDFSDQCEAKIAEFVKRTVKKAKPEFQLERLLKDDFAQRQELTGAGGKEVKIVVLDGSESTYDKFRNANSGSVGQSAASGASQKGSSGSA